MTARAFLGGGDLYLEIYNPTTKAFGLREGPFEAKKFEIKPNSEVKEQTSRGKSTYAQVIESVPLPKPTELSITMTEVTKQSMEMALFGTAAPINTAGGTITNAAVTAKLDKWVSLGHANFTDSIVVKDATDAITYVKGTDYVVNYALGMIKVLSTSVGIDADDVLHVTGTYNAITGTLISGGTQTQVRAKFILDGINFADQTACIVTVHEGIMTPESAFDFLQDNFGEIGLKGRMKTPAGFTEAFTVELRD